jgi:hypothetical protein
MGNLHNSRVCAAVCGVSRTRDDSASAGESERLALASESRPRHPRPGPSGPVRRLANHPGVARHVPAAPPRWIPRPLPAPNGQRARGDAAGAGYAGLAGPAAADTPEQRRAEGPARLRRRRRERGGGGGGLGGADRGGGGGGGLGRGLAAVARLSEGRRFGAFGVVFAIERVFSLVPCARIVLGPSPRKIGYSPGGTDRLSPIGRLIIPASLLGNTHQHPQPAASTPRRPAAPSAGTTPPALLQCGGRRHPHGASGTRVAAAAAPRQRPPPPGCASTELRPLAAK